MELSCFPNSMALGVSAGNGLGRAPAQISGFAAQRRSFAQCIQTESLTADGNAPDVQLLGEVGVRGNSQDPITV